MTTTPTPNINATLQQIAELTASGCDIVRVAVPSRDDAEALPIIAKKSQIPVIADIHFQPNYVYAAIDAGCAAVRVNPGNIRKFDDQVAEIAQAREGRRRLDPHRRERRLPRPPPAREVRQGHPRGARRERRVGGEPLRGARLPRLQDLGQAQRPDRHGEGLPHARRARRLAPAPRRHRGGPELPGHHQERDGVRHPPLRGHRRHDPRVAVGPAGRGGQGRAADPAVARTSASASSRSCRAPRAGGRRSTCTSSRTTSPTGSRA